MDSVLYELIHSVLVKSDGHRPETEWLRERSNRLARTQGVRSREELDRLIFERMYNRSPTGSETVKIRYWRTGQHLPLNRQTALDFARALELEASETAYFIKACMEKSDRMFDVVPEPEEDVYPLYRRRRQIMEVMLMEYIDQIPPTRMIQLDIPYKNLAAYARHIYCLDAMCATALSADSRRPDVMESHLSSNSYESEFLRMQKLLGEIPRRTILRHIILLGMPYLNLRIINERLEGLGYLPLTPGHTSPQGASVDDLVMRLLEYYEIACAGKDPLDCRHWLLEQLSSLDGYMLEHGLDEYRFMYFRVLSTIAGSGDRP